jgi:hypothetical protein
MTMTATARNTGAARALIDHRLDAIDRALLGRVPRADRLAIVADVETQIFELLRQHGADEPGRDDVLAVLARLDPPEAYLPDDGPFAAPAVTPFAAATPRVAPTTEADVRLGRWGGGVGVTALVLTLLTPAVWILAGLSGSEVGGLFLLFAFAALVFVGGATGVALGAFARFRSRWAVAGTITGGLAGLAALTGGLFLLLLLASE